MANTKLARYNAKRDFNLTQEPQGTVATSDSKSGSKLRFVIQKHAARHLHYDLRLELDGVFKSWAVTRGPSINPGDKRLAVEVEDHPLAYGDFEGTIPAGEYGGGTVQLWDRGYWQPIFMHASAKQSESTQSATTSARAALKAGELKFTLQGERLQGSWVLVRMRDQARGRHNWLLIKHADTDKPDHKQSAAALTKAAAALLDMDESVASGRSMAQIAAGKPPSPTPFMKAGTKPQADPRLTQTTRTQISKSASRDQHAAKTISRLPAFIAPQLCKLVSTPPSGDDWVHELKLDGYRMQLRVVDGKVTLKTRSGLDWTHKCASLAAAAKQLPDCIIDTELVALNAEGQPDFAALQAALSEGETQSLVLFAFDLVCIEHADIRALPLLERKQRLKALLNESGPLRYLEHFSAAGQDLLQSACNLQMEGLISKRADAPYASGRGNGWLKCKCRAGHEVIIGGMTHDHGQLRSLLVGVMRDQHLVYVGRVGTGFSAATSRRVMPRLKTLITQDNPFQGDTAPRKQSNFHWLQPTQVAEIEFAGWTGGGMVRQAAFKGLRDDKPAREVKAEQPVATQRLKKPKAAAGRKAAHVKPNSTLDQASRVTASRADTSAVTLTHPDKPLWPRQGNSPAVTKSQLADYFANAAEWLLPHIQGRPCSIVRAPDGIGQQQFFQRHAMAGSPQFKLIKVSGDRKPYLQIDSADALQGVAQLAGIELHPWNCVPLQPEQPGRLVFDLDPAPDVAFTQVIKAALELRERLRELQLESFCKTTGGKGLHVVVPLTTTKAKRNIDWPTTKLFAQTLCAQMAGDNPTQYLINMSKAKRTGKIFLDYLRNDRMATAIAPLSPRARTGATVSMPLLWNQVKNTLQPQRFTVHTAMELLAKHRPWQDYDSTDNQLLNAVKQLLKTGARAA